MVAEVTIRQHTRRGKGGKTVQVRGYSRRVGRKGVHSPKRDKSEQPGEELEKVKEKKETPKLTPEEIEQRREVMEGFKRAEAEMKSLGMSREQYSRYKLKQQRESKKTSTSTHAKTIKNPLSPQGSLGILERVEDKIAKFVEKYSGKKYKRQL